MADTLGPQLIGRTEKTLNALLRRVLVEHDLEEPQWVTLRLAAQHDDDSSLADVVRRRAHFADAEQIVAVLARRGLLADDEPTSRGREVLDDLQQRIATLTRPVWADLDPDDVAATERVLTTIDRRADRVLHVLKD